MFQLLQRMSQPFSKGNQREFDEFRIVIDTFSKLDQGALSFEGEMSIFLDDNSKIEKCYTFSKSLNESYFSIPNQNLFYAKKEMNLFKIVENEIIQLSAKEWLKPILEGHLNLNDFLHYKNLLMDFDGTLLGDEMIEGRSAAKWALVPKENFDSGWKKINVWFEEKSKKLIRLDFYDSQLEFQRRIDLEEDYGSIFNTVEKLMPKKIKAQVDLNSSSHTIFEINKIHLYTDESYKDSEAYNRIWDRL